MNLSSRKITELVDENYVYAHVLYYFGIQFYEHTEITLEQACWQKGLDVAQVIQSLEAAPVSGHASDIPVEDLPVDLVIAYLKHTHHLFIKQKLPYVARLIEKLNPQTAPLIKDLQMVFPLFVEDFIYHIYEEEDTLFTYISLLSSTKTTSLHPGKLHYAMRRHSIQKYAVAHDTHDEEMQGIRNITNDYTPDLHAELHLKVVFFELRTFEQELQLHARVENEILFPKALRLEQEVKEKMRQLAISN